MKNILILLFVFLLSGACEFNRELDVEISDAKAVLNGIIFADSVFMVNVSTSYSSSSVEAQTIFIDDAEISFSLNGSMGGFLERMNTKGTYCMPGYIARSGDDIALEVKTGSFETLKSKTRIPERAQILSVDTMMYVLDNPVPESNKYGLKITMDMRIHKKEKCYYLFSFSSWEEYKSSGEEEMYISYDRFTVYPTALQMHPDTYFLSDYIYPLRMRVGDQALHTNYLIFSNEFFEKEEIQLSLDFSGIPLSYYDEDISFSKYYKVRFLSISPSFYLYLHSRLVQYQTNDFIFETDTYATQPSFTNVEGGYGLFSSVCEDGYEIKLVAGDEPPP